MIRKKVIFVLGNEIEPTDSAAVKLLPQLQALFPQITFQRLDPTEELPKNATDELILIDTVIGISKVEMINDLNHLSLSPRVTVHDFDLPLSLGLAQKLGKIKKVTIIGIPPKGNIKEILTQSKRVIKELFPSFSTT